MFEWWQSQRATVLWWSLAAGVAAALKGHFSVAAASELSWMLRPLALVLRVVTGWRFEHNAEGEWYSLGAGIVLVKACAGINFMIMSFIGWCWVSRPQRRGTPAAMAPLEWPLFLGSALVFAWVTTLIANTLRILAIVHWQPQLELWLPPGPAHRMLGLMVYLPMLNLQLLLADWRHWQSAVLVAGGLYLLLMLIVPLSTGNAAANPIAYAEHAVMTLAALAPMVAAGYVWRRHHRS